MTSEEHRIKKVTDVLSSSRLRILGRIVSYFAAHGFAPTVRELAKMEGCNINNIQGHTEALRRRGLLVNASVIHARSLIPTCRIERIP